MTDPFGSEKSDCIPDTLGSSCFAGVNGNAPAGIAALAEMLGEKRRGEICLIAGEIECDQMLSVR